MVKSNRKTSTKNRARHTRKVDARPKTRAARRRTPHQRTNLAEQVSPLTKAAYSVIEMEKNAVDVVFDTFDAVLYFLFGPRAMPEPPEENKLASWTLPDVPKVVERAVSEARAA